MEEESHKEGTKSVEHDLMTCHPPLLRREPYIWLMITDVSDGSERIFYSVTEDRCYVRFVPELKNKHVACCYGGWLVLRDKSTDDCSILNILTMEKLQLPRLNIPPHHNIPPHQNNKSICRLCTDCVVSSTIMDRSCRVIFIEKSLSKFWSCHLGDNEFIEREWAYKDVISSDLINFKGKLYAMTAHDLNLIAFDFLDPELHHEQVIGGESLPGFIFCPTQSKLYLVESCGDLLLIFMANYDCEVSDVQIFKADLSVGEWVILETLGDRAIFLGARNNTFSCPATAVGMKGDAVYWVRALLSYFPPQGPLYMYDIEDKSISMTLPFPYDIEDESISMTLPSPFVEFYSSLSWVSFPMNYNGSEQKDRSCLFEASPIETNLLVQPAIESKELEIEQRNIQKTEETKTIMVRKESLWADLSSDLLLEIFPHLFAGDSVAFRSVCRSWYSLSPTTRISQQFLLPLKSLDRFSSPLLMCPDNKIYDPIHGKLYSMDFPDKQGAKLRATRNGWLLMDYYSRDNYTRDLFFYNPITKAKMLLPDCYAVYYYSVFFSAPPTSADCLVVVAAYRWDKTDAICFKMYEDEDWTCREISSFDFSFSNAVVYEGVYYFLGRREYGPEVLIFNPKKDEIRVIESPFLKFGIAKYCPHQYMLESDGKLIVVFVEEGGSSVYTYEWNMCTSKWEILGSLGNKMLFVSRPLSLCERATVSGTGNKIYFPKVVGDGHILFYSLVTRRYHTFEMGTSYPNFCASKFYPQHNGWFMP